MFYHTADVFLNLCHSNIVNPKLFYNGDVDIGSLLNTFFANTWENDSWPELEWFTNKLYLFHYFSFSFLFKSSIDTFIYLQSIFSECWTFWKW